MRNVICDDFRQNVITILERKGWSRSDLSRAIGCSPAYVTQILNGSHEPGLRVVERFSEALGVSVATLLKKIPKSA